MAMEHEEAISTVWELIYELEEEKFFSSNYAEQLEECDFYNGDSCDKIPYEKLDKIIDETNHYMMLRSIIESIKEYKKAEEKEKRKVVSYCKVIKKQQENSKKLKEEIKELKEQKEIFRVSRCKRDQELVEALQPFKKDYQNHKRIIETIKRRK